MKMRHVYLFLLAAGIIFPYTFFGPWFLENGLNVRLFFVELFSTGIGGGFGMDVFVSITVLMVFAWAEIRRLNIRRGWLILAAVFVGANAVGVSCGFPLFLYLRQKHIDNLVDELSGNARDSRFAREEN